MGADRAGADADAAGVADVELLLTVAVSIRSRGGR